MVITVKADRKSTKEIHAWNIFLLSEAVQNERKALEEISEIIFAWSMKIPCQFSC